MKKICFLSGVISRSGGTERVGTMIANALFLAGYEVTILSFWDRGTPFFKVESGIKVDYLLKPSEGKLYRTFIYPVLKLHNYIIHNHIDVLIDIDTLLTRFSSRAISGTKCKLVDWEHFNYLHTMEDKRRRKCLKLSIKNASKIVVLTKEDYNFHVEKGNVPKEKITYIYNPTPFEGKSPSLCQGNNVIAVGRLTYQKGFDLLVKAWQLVEKNNNSLILNIIGSGEDVDKLKKLALSLNLQRCNFIPATSEIEEWYNMSCLYVMSSRFEGFPMVLLEAIAKGLPIVSFGCPTGPKEIVIDGKGGYLVPNFDVGILAQKIIEIAEDRRKLSNFSKFNVEFSKSFYMDKILPEWIKLIEELV